MTTQSPAELLRQAREALALNADIDPQATIVERLAKTRAVLAAIDALPSAPAWPCHCDERGIGKPGVTCGDCPRDYGHAVSSAPSGEPVEYLFVQMDDDGRAWHRWCTNHAEVREAVKAAMFFVADGEELSAEHTDQLDASVDVLIDDGRLSFEGDPPLYLFRMAGATWEKAPAAQAAPAPQAAVQPLTDEQVKDCLVKAHCFGSVRLTYDSGPYEVTSPTVDAIRLAGVIVSEFCRLAGIATLAAPKGQQ